MEIKILENKNQDLYVYKNDEIIFYSKIEISWTNRNIVKIFNGNDELIIELKVYMPFLETKYKIIYQNNTVTRNISKISREQINFGLNRKINLLIDSIISLNSNYSYFSRTLKIAAVKQKMWNSPQKMILKVEENELELLDIIIIHILAISTGAS